MKKIFLSDGVRYIIICAAYLFLISGFFSAGYLIGKNTAGVTDAAETGVISRNVEESEERATQQPVSVNYRVILEDGEIRLYKDENGFSRLVSNEEISEGTFPVSDIAALKQGFTFSDLQEALSLMENFIA